MEKDFWSVIYAECTNPDIVDVEMSEDGFVEVECLCEGILYEFGFQNKSLMYIEQSVRKKDIPFERIKSKLEKDYGEWILDDISIIKTGDTAFFKIEVLNDGVEQNLYFTEDGKWYELQRFNALDEWEARRGIEKLSGVAHSFSMPKAIFEMPDILREISGIALGENGLLYCVQDELGAIFEYDLKAENVANIFRFTDVGDFEDIAIHDKYIIVLRSDGLLFNYDLKKKKLKYTNMLPLNSLDVEGLCSYDDALFVASKAPQINQSEQFRTIYRVGGKDFSQITIHLEIDVNEINHLANTTYSNLNNTRIEFNPSALEFHPITGELYVLSASDRALAVYKDKVLTNIILLPAEGYYKPEGLAFSENGELYISNEGDKKGFNKANTLVLPSMSDE